MPPDMVSIRYFCDVGECCSVKMSPCGVLTSKIEAFFSVVGAKRAEAQAATNRRFRNPGSLLRSANMTTNDTALALTAALNRVRTRTKYGLTPEGSSANSRLHSIFQSLDLRHRW